MPTTARIGSRQRRTDQSFTRIVSHTRRRKGRARGSHP
jgi:hypothetical protein